MEPADEPDSEISVAWMTWVIRNLRKFVKRTVIPVAKTHLPRYATAHNKLRLLTVLGVFFALFLMIKELGMTTGRGANPGGMQGVHEAGSSIRATVVRHAPGKVDGSHNAPYPRVERAYTPRNHQRLGLLASFAAMMGGGIARQRRVTNSLSSGMAIQIAQPRAESRKNAISVGTSGALLVNLDNYQADGLAGRAEATTTGAVLQQPSTIRTVDLRATGEEGIEEGTESAGKSRRRRRGDRKPGKPSDERCPEGCGANGICSRTGCRCAALYEGPSCNSPRWPPDGIQLPPGMPDPKLLLSPGFQDDYVMHKLGQAGRRASFTLDQPGGLPMAMKVAGEAYQELIKRLPVRDEVLGHTIFPSCAVVGSSGSLLAYQLGREIDAHGMVLRFNDAPTRNYERHVGSKTTHRLSDGQSIGFHEFKHESLLVLLATLEAVKSFKSVAQANSALRMWPLDPEWTRHVARSMALPATTSMQGLLLALQRCQRVRVFGFQMGQPHDVPHHYYDVCAAPRHPKRYASEAGVLKFLVEAGWVEPGEPCLMQCLHPSGHECARCKLDSNFQSVHLDVSQCSKHASTRAQQQLPQTAASGQPRPKLRSPV